jgi:hypothetical protein
MVCSFVLVWNGRAVVVSDAGLQRSSAGEKIEDEHNDCEDEKDVDPAAEGVAADESNDPEDEENNGDCPKHFRLLNDFSGSQ